MQNGEIIFNNLQSLTEKELEAINMYKNGTKRDFKKFFQDNFEEEYDYSFVKFKESLLNKARGKSTITVASEGSFANALDKAFVQSATYDVESYRNFGTKGYEMISHFGKTEEAQNMILDYIANGTPIDSDAMMKANARYFDGKLVNHGLYGFPGEMYSVKGPTNNPLQRIESNVEDILADSSMELSLSSHEYMVGPIGLTGTIDASVYHTNDIRSHIDWDTGKRIYQPNKSRATGTIEDIIDSIERGKDNLFTKHDELIGSNFKPQSLWVKEGFYGENKDYVHSLLKKYNIQSLDIVHASESTEKISKDTIETINLYDNTKLVLSENKKYKATRGPKLKEKLKEPVYADVSGRKYITCGTSEFDIDKFKPVKNNGRKPSGGLWASPTDSPLTWKEWLEWEMPEWKEKYSESFEFSLTPDARLLEINTLQELNDRLGKNIGPDDFVGSIDFEGLAKHYDAVQINVGSNRDELYWPLYGWDIDSLVVLNPNVIQPAKPVKSVNIQKNIKSNFTVNKIISDAKKDISIQLSDAKTILTPQEAFNKYGPNSDEFYISQGLDPKQQREIISKLNSGRKQIDNTPIEIKQFQQKLDKLGITEDEYYRRFNEEMTKPLKKRYTSAPGPKLKQEPKITPEVSIHSSPEIERKPVPTFTKPSPDTRPVKPIKPTSTPVKSPKPVSSKPNINTHKPTPKMQSKSLNGGGVGAIVTGVVAGIAGFAVTKAVSSKQKDKADRQIYDKDVQSQQIDNSYAIQMAQDISSYRYGKHMTGFVNF